MLLVHLQCHYIAQKSPRREKVILCYFPASSILILLALFIRVLFPQNQLPDSILCPLLHENPKGLPLEMDFSGNTISFLIENANVVNTCILIHKSSVSTLSDSLEEKILNIFHGPAV
ncbi:hypothetical protein AVEN_50193-1 [Araneus ventricosus]|uniref:Uncharacterized protein n=1 Tax=Araneus ventricosus TaxID=182803 RepID=A0A4Y2W1G1_ARAVE|nr:hypothetical protein AVEN_50193-1 [Araneus ventricosus]